MHFCPEKKADFKFGLSISVRCLVNSCFTRSDDFETALLSFPGDEHHGVQHTGHVFGHESPCHSERVHPGETPQPGHQSNARFVLSGSVHLPIISESCAQTKRFVLVGKITSCRLLFARINKKTCLSALHHSVCLYVYVYV